MERIVVDDRYGVERTEDYYEWLSEFFARLDEEGYWDSCDFEND